MGSKPYPSSKRSKCFIAVGVAHLGGDLGVINLLRKADTPLNHEIVTF
jgi:uncharacterized protein YbaP (TraB family)